MENKMANSDEGCLTVLIYAFLLAVLSVWHSFLTITSAILRQKSKVMNAHGVLFRAAW